MRELKEYEEPIMTIEYFSCEDVITTSSKPEVVVPNYDHSEHYLDEDDPT